MKFRPVQKNRNEIDDIDILLFAAIEKAALHREQEILAMLEEEEDPDYEFSDFHRREMEKIIHPRRKQHSKGLRIAASIGLLTCLMLLPLSVEASRIRFFSFLTDVNSGLHDIYVKLTFQDADNKEPKMPSYLPAGYKELQKTGSRIIYRNADDRYIAYSWYTLDKTSPAYNKEDYEVQEIPYKDGTMYLFTDRSGLNDNILIWREGEYGYDLSSKEGIDTLIEIAKKIK